MRAIATREDLADLILDAADVLLARYGYKKMTMDDIAREVGIGKGTIYLHFRSKEEIALARIDRLVKRLIERLNEIAGSDDSAAARLQRMLQERVLYRFDSVQHYTESLRDVLAAIRPALLTRHNRHFEQETQVFAAILKEGQKTGEFHAQDAKALAHAMLVATNALLPYSLSPGELGDRAYVEAQVTRIAELLTNGLKSTSTPSRRRRDVP